MTYQLVYITWNFIFIRLKKILGVVCSTEVQQSASFLFHFYFIVAMYSVSIYM